MKNLRVRIIGLHLMLAWTQGCKPLNIRGSNTLYSLFPGGNKISNATDFCSDFLVSIGYLPQVGVSKSVN